MFCAQCGTAVKDGAKFCGKCGWAVAPDTTAVNTPSPQTEAQSVPAQAVPAQTPPVPPQQAALYTGQTPYQGPPQYQQQPVQTPPPYSGQPYPAQYRRMALPAVDFSADRGITTLKKLSIVSLSAFVAGLLIFSSGNLFNNETLFANFVSFLIFGGLFAQSLFALVKGVKYKKIAVIVVYIIALLASVFLFLVQFLERYYYNLLVEIVKMVRRTGSHLRINLLGLLFLLYPFVSSIVTLVSFRKRNIQQTYYGN